jgi:hypothetical protein
MIEEGSEWEAHARTKVHKRLASKKAEGKRQPAHILAAQGKGDKTRGDSDLIGNADDALGRLFGS